MAKRLPPPFGLTPDQEELYHSVVPREVDRAAASVVRGYRVENQVADLKQEGTVAIGLGIPKFDPDYETPFPQWAFFCALHAMLQIVRVEGRYRQQVAGLRLAVTLHCAFQTGTFNAARDAEDVARAALTKYTQRLAMGTLVRLAATPQATPGEGDVVLRETHRRVVEVMQKLVSELTPQQRELLQLAYSYEKTNVKQAAALLGEKGYRAALRAYHELLELLGARFAGAGFTELPPWPEEASGTILGSQAAANAP
jgi:DNA-directed RNA polymerase specialized sigma24 family protein